MTALAHFHFLRPLWLLALLAIPLFWILRRRVRGDAGAWRAAVDAHLLPHLIERVEGGGGRAGALLATALWTLATAALAGPAWERVPVPLYRNQAARVLAVELGQSMLAEDAKPSRLERARFKLDDILARSRDYQTALIGYAGDAFVAAPLTDDVATVRNLVDALDPSTMPVGGNHAARAIEEAERLIHQAGLHSGEIIVLADGADDAAISAARAAHADGETVSVLGIGTTAGAPVPLAQGDFMKDDSGHVVVSRLDEPSLRALAEAGGGRYARLTADAGDVESLLSRRTDTGGEDAASASDDIAGATRWRDRGPWLLLLVLPLAALAFRRGWLMAIALAILLPMPRADASALENLWMRPDQQAAAALAKGDAKEAARVAKSPDWRATAAYRDGDFKSAAKDFGELSSADGAYNAGNALAKLGRYEDAIAAYDRALQVEPGMDDAKANKAAIEAWLKQQQKKSSDDESSQSKNSGDSSQQQKQQQSSNGQSKDDNQNSRSDANKQQQGGNGQDSQQQDKPGESGKDGDSDQDQGQGRQSGSKDDKGNDPAKSKQAAGAPSKEQQQALSKDIDQSLASAKQGGTKKPAQAAAAPEDDASREKRQALEHLLQRVPDDPGGLLRRKFMLEYQRRHERGEEGG